MSEDALHDSAPAYVLGSLSEPERHAFVAHLSAGCGRCTHAVAELQPVLEALSQGSAAPPAPEIRSLLLDLVDAPELPLDPSAYSWEETDPGVRQAIVRHDPDRNVTGALLWAKPGAFYPPHRHRGHESLLVLQGHCRDEAGEYRAGSVARKRPGSTHGVEFLPGEDCIGYVVTYGGHERIE